MLTNQGEGLRQAASRGRSSGMVGAEDVLVDLMGPGAVRTAPGWRCIYFLNVKKVREAVSVMLTLPLVVSVTVVV